MIKILTSDQLRAADQYTIDHEPVMGIDLMERAAHALQFSILEEAKVPSHSAFFIFCGYGNNGGDGLALGRLLYPDAESVNIFCLADKNERSPDFKINFERLTKIPLVNHFNIKNENDFPVILENAVIIDALFGSGLNKTLQGLPKKLVAFLNDQKATRIAVDIPSGLFADRCSDGLSFRADHTITFQCPKLSFLFADSYESIGEVHVADIGLSKEFIASQPCKNFLVDESDIRQRLRSRKKFDHKGKFGHAFIHAGNIGKMGAAIMCAKACTRTGAGLTTAHIPINQSTPLNIAVPEAMTEEYANSHSPDLELSNYSAFAFGPGIGTHKSQRESFFSLLKKNISPSLFDADALNILAEEKKWWERIPKNSILTPHPKEFERLAGKTSDWEKR
ncbi:MAG: NAD(P)H-hydrate epimerase, partial [Chitinophagales bacterium]